MKEDRKDERFTSVLKDPRFKKIPVQEHKTKIDKRFQAVFKDKNYKLNYVMDKYGRPMGHTSSEDLKRLYHLHSSESEDEKDSACSDDDASCALNVDHIETCDLKNVVKDHNEVPSDRTSDEAEHKLEFQESKTGDESTSESGDSDSDFTTDEEKSNLAEEDNEDFDHKWDELDTNAPIAAEITKRLALCNMDWDRIRAEDILSVFNSFKPSNGIIHSVKIYPSEFGLQRMEEEKLRGPLELVENTVKDENKKNDTSKEGSQYHREKLRQYQITRLKYYYAVIECDSSETANSLYEQLNGMEYESSAVCLDIRFIPDDVIFDQEPKSTAVAIPCPSEYKPRLFINSALQQVKVNLTWDETDPKRRETLQRAFREPESIDKDIKNYLASSSSSDSEGDDASVDAKASRKLKMKERIANYRSLLQSLEEKEKDNENNCDMEITWEPGLKEKTKEMVKEKLTKATLNPFEEKVKKMKEEKKQKKKEKRKHFENGKVSENAEISSNDDDDVDDGFYCELNQKHNERKSSNVEAEIRNKMADELALLMTDPGDKLQNENMKKKRKQKKKSKEKNVDDFQVDVEDSRFSAIYTSHLYNIDPSDPHYKMTKGMQSIIEEKQRKRKHYDDSTVHESSSKETKLSRDAIWLIESVKRKTECKKKNK